MLRDKWEFKFTAKKLADGATKKFRHHRERVLFWQDAKAKVMAEVKESGIEVTESAACNNTSNYTRGMTPQVMVRNDLQIRLTECHEKIQEHQRKVNEYAGWLQVFENNPETQLSLNADDYLYFFGE